MLLDKVTGFTLALTAMLLYGVYMVPRKKSPISQSAFTFWMGFGILVGSGIITLVSGGVGRVNLAQLALIFGSGLVWATGTHTYCLGVKSIGLSRSTPIKNASAILAALLGIAVLHEFALDRPLPLALVVLASIAVVGSAAVLGGVEAMDSQPSKPGSKSVLWGILYSAWAAVAYSVYTVPMKIVYRQGVTPADFLFYMSLGCFVGMSITARLTRPRSKSPAVTWRDRGLAQFSGLMWVAGSLAANIAVKLIGVAITWPLTKTTVVAVAYGALILKEIDMSRHKRAVWIGVALSIAGVALLAWATSIQ